MICRLISHSEDFMNANYVMRKIQSLIHNKNALIAFNNDVELSCEHSAMFQLKTLNHIHHIMHYLQETRLKILNSDCDLEHEKSIQEIRLCSVHLQYC